MQVWCNESKFTAWYPKPAQCGGVLKWLSDGEWKREVPQQLNRRLLSHTPEPRWKVRCQVPSRLNWWRPAACPKTLQEETTLLPYECGRANLCSSCPASPETLWAYSSGNESVHAPSSPFPTYANERNQVLDCVIWWDLCPIFDSKQWRAPLPGAARLSKCIMFTSFIPSRAYSMPVFSSLGCLAEGDNVRSHSQVRVDVRHLSMSEQSVFMLNIRGMVINKTIQFYWT